METKRSNIFKIKYFNVVFIFIFLLTFLSPLQFQYEKIQPRVFNKQENIITVVDNSHNNLYISNRENFQRTFDIITKTVDTLPFIFFVACEDFSLFFETFLNKNNNTLINIFNRILKTVVLRL